MVLINKTAKITCGLAVGTSFTIFANYYKHTKDVLSGAVDSSVIDVYEQEQYPVSYIPETDWIEPTCVDTAGPFHRFINFLRFVYAKRLLNIAQGDNQMLRVRALNHLTKLQLDKWQYCLIAHMCDPRTAIGLARSADNTEHFFLPPPRKYGINNEQLLLNTLKDYVNLLFTDTKNKHGCLQKAVSKMYLQNYTDVNRILDAQHDTEALAYIGKDSEDVLPLILETIQHHSAISRWTKDILNHHGLYLLMETHNRYSDDINISIPLCNILSNISRKPELTDELFKAGWITVLAKWARHRDIRLSAPAAQALANLDADDVSEKYSQNVFPLYPTSRTVEKPLVDVVFIHGLLGSVFYTWRNGKGPPKRLDLAGKKRNGLKLGSESIGLDDCNNEHLMAVSSDPVVHEYLQEVAENQQCEWNDLGSDYEFVQCDIPEEANTAGCGRYLIDKNVASRFCNDTQCWARDWLPKDCAHLRILGVNYSTTLSLWAQMCPDVGENVSLDQRTEELTRELIDAGLGKRPIVWVTHSMGGLLAKNVIAQGLMSDDIKRQDLAFQSRAIFFFSTPHAGSKAAALNQIASYFVWPSLDVKELREDSPNLVRIHNQFLDVLKVVPIKVISFVENKPTIISALKLNFELVEKQSGDPGFGECYEIPLNHLGICKPSNRQSFLYQKVLREIHKIVQQELKQSPSSDHHRIGFRFL